MPLLRQLYSKSLKTLNDCHTISKVFLGNFQENNEKDSYKLENQELRDENTKLRKENEKLRKEIFNLRKQLNK